ncbi:Acetyl-CoA acetyltransferase [Geobacillus sp. BCO2]|nr:Acetyl-CoA acetyltransferase [Geobacillus sp. BCO2]
MGKTVIVSGARTPFGKFGGSLQALSASELGGIAVKEALARADVSAEQVDHVILGTVLQGGKASSRRGRRCAMPAFRGMFAPRRSIKYAHRACAP